MGPQAKKKIETIEHCTEVLKKVLSHFDKKAGKEAFDLVSAACDYAYTDQLLFEVFELWFSKEISDKALLFQLNHFFNTKYQKPLSESERDLTGNDVAIQKIKNAADNEIATNFANQLKVLAHKKGLTTNEKLGEFLDVSSERARILLQGKHKPQFETLSKIAERFKVPLETFLKE
jgi:hypothetical protein